MLLAGKGSCRLYSQSVFADTVNYPCEVSSLNRNRRPKALIAIVFADVLFNPFARNASDRAKQNNGAVIFYDEIRFG
jgi:hypothetical protein